MKKYILFIFIMVFLMITIVNALNVTLEKTSEWRFDQLSGIRIISYDDNYGYLNPHDISFDYRNINSLSINKLDLNKIDTGIYEQYFTVSDLADREKTDITIIVDVTRHNETISNSINITIEKSNYFEDKYLKARDEIDENPYLIIIILFVVVVTFIVFAIIVITVVSDKTKESELP